jgi:hypothetical protein
MYVPTHQVMFLVCELHLKMLHRKLYELHGDFCNVRFGLFASVLSVHSAYTYSMKQVFLEKLTNSQQVKKFPALY